MNRFENMYEELAAAWAVVKDVPDPAHDWEEVLRQVRDADGCPRTAVFLVESQEPAAGASSSSSSSPSSSAHGGGSRPRRPAAGASSPSSPSSSPGESCELVGAYAPGEGFIVGARVETPGPVRLSPTCEPLRDAKDNRLARLAWDRKTRSHFVQFK